MVRKYRLHLFWCPELLVEDQVHREEDLLLDQLEGDEDGLLLEVEGLHQEEDLEEEEGGHPHPEEGHLLEAEDLLPQDAEVGQEEDLGHLPDDQEHLLRGLQEEGPVVQQDAEDILLQAAPILHVKHV